MPLFRDRPPWLDQAPFNDVWPYVVLALGTLTLLAAMETLYADLTQGRGRVPQEAALTATVFFLGGAMLLCGALLLSGVLTTGGIAVVALSIALLIFL